MGLFTGMLLLPLAPVRGVVKLAEVIQEQVEQEANNPARTRRQLEELEEQRERGEISAEEEKDAQSQILQTKVAPKTVGKQSDKRPDTQAENKAGEQSGRGQRRAAAKESNPRSSASVRRRSGVSSNKRPRRSV